MTRRDDIATCFYVTRTHIQLQGSYQLAVAIAALKIRGEMELGLVGRHSAAGELDRESELPDPEASELNVWYLEAVFSFDAKCSCIFEFRRPSGCSVRRM